MPCVEGDKSDCQPEANSGGYQGLRIWSITLNTGHGCFFYTRSQSFTHLVYLYTLGLFKTQDEPDIELVLL